MATLHIKVKDRPELDGTIPLPFTAATTYSCSLGVFSIAPLITVGGTGTKPTISGSFSMSPVPEDYGTVTFSGTYVARGGAGSGGLNWTGSHPATPDGDDTWTSDTTTPEPKKRPLKGKAKAKTQSY